MFLSFISLISLIYFCLIILILTLLPRKVWISSRLDPDWCPTMYCLWHIQVGVCDAPERLGVGPAFLIVVSWKNAVLCSELPSGGTCFSFLNYLIKSIIFFFYYQLGPPLFNLYFVLIKLEKMIYSIFCIISMTKLCIYCLLAGILLAMVIIKFAFALSPYCIFIFVAIIPKERLFSFHLY